MGARIPVQEQAGPGYPGPMAVAGYPQKSPPALGGIVRTSFLLSGRVVPEPNRPAEEWAPRRMDLQGRFLLCEPRTIHA